MKSKVDVCTNCQKEKKIHARNMCARCYYIFLKGPHWWNIKKRPGRPKILETCEICKTVKKICVDHDHNCKKHDKNKYCSECIRGKLCTKCNIMLGFAQDSPEILYAAVDYLDRWNKRDR